MILDGKDAPARQRTDPLRNLLALVLIDVVDAPHHLCLAPGGILAVLPQLESKDRGVRLA